jgi:U3 small nucleolar RNA-associated protein 10
VQVLLVSRSENADARLAAIECVFNIVTRLREEYLGLLPESLPFLAELLEDSDTAVLARCKDLVKLLEELSDENLEGYLKM